MASLIPEIYYAAACYTMMLTFLICGIIRLGHCCKTHNNDVSYLYPARKIVCLAYVSICFHAPYIFHWHSADAWLLARSFFILFIPAASTLAIKRFFFADKRWRLSRTIAIGGLPATLILSLSVIASLGGNLTERFSFIQTFVVITAIFLALYLVRVTIWLRQLTNDYLHGEYSDDEEFPTKFATFIVYIPIVALIIAWGIYLCNSRAITACMNIATAAIGVFFLLRILHPQRYGKIKITETDNIVVTEIDTTDIAPDTTHEEVRERRTTTCALPDTVKDKMEKQIRALVEENQLFLRQGLTRTELSEMLGSNRTYLSIVLKERFVSFYTYINTLRIEYALQYIRMNPEADQQEIASNSGFGSVKTYTRVKKAYESGQLQKITS